MAAGFKTATVNASSVAATQTNFPSYVDLSRLGITTTAEANSVRVYADSGKTTEWAREIVSVSEMHVKIPSLTTTTSIYVDWDGSRADYAASDTYGRNAVWSDYKFVFHLESDGLDSTGAGTASATGTVTYTSSSPLGNGSTTSGSADNYLLGGGNFVDGTGNKTISMWAQTGDRTKRSWYVDCSNRTSDASPATFRDCVGFYQDSSTLYFYGLAADPSLGAVPANNTPFYAVATYNGTILRTYLNDTAQGTNTNSFSFIKNPSGVKIHIRNYDATSSRLNGKVTELRGRAEVLSTTWCTTEYNNQNAESTFWGTWSTVGGSYTATPQMHMMQITGGII